MVATSLSLSPPSSPDRFGIDIGLTLCSSFVDAFDIPGEAFCFSSGTALITGPASTSGTTAVVAGAAFAVKFLSDASRSPRLIPNPHAFAARRTFATPRPPPPAWIVPSSTRAARWSSYSSSGVVCVERVSFPATVSVLGMIARCGTGEGGDDAVSVVAAAASATSWRRSRSVSALAATVAACSCRVRMVACSI